MIDIIWILMHDKSKFLKSAELFHIIWTIRYTIRSIPYTNDPYYMDHIQYS